MKTLDQLTIDTLRVEEMFNVRGGDGDENQSSSSKNTTAKGEGEDIIL